MYSRAFISQSFGNIITKPTFGYVIAKPTFGYVIANPTFGYVIAKPTFGYVIAKPTFGYDIAKPTFGYVIAKAFYKSSWQRTPTSVKVISKTPITYVLAVKNISNENFLNVINVEDEIKKWRD